MGFGLLFIGYFIAFLMSLNSYGYAFAIVGYYLIFVALQKLSEYKHILHYCIPALLIMVFARLCQAFNGVLEMIEIYSPLSTDTEIAAVSAVLTVSTFIFNILLFRGIIALGNDTELPDVVRLGITNIALASISFALTAVTMLLTSVFRVNNRFLTMTTLFLQILTPILALALIFRCVWKICAPEDADMPQKPSRFKFINDIRTRNAEKADELRKTKAELMVKSTLYHSHKKKKK